jgi:hypothetical protein
MYELEIYIVLMEQQKQKLWLNLSHFMTVLS